MLEFVAGKLGKLCDEVVFLGGCTTALFITDVGSLHARATEDVDCIIDVISLYQYDNLREKLIEKGFKQSMQDTVICRWHYDEMTLDVMPTDEKILGFGNRWYKSAIQHAYYHPLNEKLKIKIVTAPYFIATKYEAFKTRGNMDYAASHDMEDIIAVLDGRIEIIKEIEQADSELKEYLKSSLSDMLSSTSFNELLPGHFGNYQTSVDEKVIFLLRKIHQIVK